MKSKTILLTFCILSAFIACQENTQMSQRFLEIDSLTYSHPDSALAILDTMRTMVNSCSQALRMRYEMLYAKAQNRAYVDFKTDSVMLEVCDYYDHYGTSNERMMAHYLLGCTYRDLGESAKTLECYKNAVECADTLSKDCDYSTMMSIYGQMAKIYAEQAMPMEELEMYGMAGKYALLHGDTLDYIKSFLLQVNAYSILHDTTNVYSLSSKARRMFLEYGDTALAARSLYMPIANKIKYGKFEEARLLMNIYEMQSGLFDEEGNIEQRYSHYYNSKGIYYTELQQLDSAEYYFRKLLKRGFALDADKGLLKTFSYKKNIDSVTHYAKLYADEIEEKFTRMNMESIRRSEAMYNYSRNQHIAHEESIKRKNREKQLILFAFFSFVAFVIVIYVFWQNKQKKLQTVKRLTDEYITLSDQYENNRKELELSKQNFTEFESRKNLEQQMLVLKMHEFQAKFEGLNDVRKRRALTSTSIVSTFKELAAPKPNMQCPTSKQWSQLSHALKQTIPDVYEPMSSSKLTEQEFRVAILTYLEFTVADIAILMDCTSQRVSNAKRNANKKMFGKDDSKSFAQNLHHMWHANNVITHEHIDI